MSVWLITGATGFVGRHVLDVLEEGDGEPGASRAEVIILGRRRPTGWPEHRFIGADLADPADVHRAVQRVAPDFVIHTTGRTPPATDEELYRANFWATVHLMSALRTLKKPMRVVLSGSAAELGPVETSALPVDESRPCRPVDAYGRSKWLATLAGLSERAPLDVIIARVFNPIGPGTPETQAFGRFAALLGTPGPDPLTLTVGDLDARRDFIDVRDVARAMLALGLRGEAGRVYHVGTGVSHQVREGLDFLIRLSGRSVRLGLDPQLGNRRGPTDSRAAIDRITAHTGWQPSIAWERSLSDLWSSVRDTAGEVISPAA